ncbi:MAG: TAT-variant-translocated molybdopterin oxidoreductase, partial [Planctomycetes bacterium]|nr:TAT-variant-translocated molybdopterin oxidoreductase [Planctomycetota bacterium]
MSPNAQEGASLKASARAGASSAEWRSLSDLENTPEFQELLAREFPDQDPQSVPEVDRRRFLQLMGASAALAMLSSCRWEAEQILPFNRRPEGMTPGVAKHFATCVEFGGVAQPLLLRNYDGRPIKVEGNPEHPASLGASTMHAQALTLEWADPDRSQVITHKKGGTQDESNLEAFQEFVDEHFGELRDGGAGLAVLGAPTSSPTMLDLARRFRDVFPDNAGWFTYEPLNRDNEVEGAAIAFGKPLRAHYKLDEADVQLWLDADPLGSHPNSLRYSRDWASRRVAEVAIQDGEPMMTRVYAVESTPSVSGSVADHRLPLRSDRIHGLLLEIERSLDGTVLASRPAWLDEEPTKKFIAAVVEDLQRAGPKVLVAVGPRQPAVVHAIAHRINQKKGAIGKTVVMTEEPVAAKQTEGLAALVRAMNAGTVKTLVMLGGNPVFDAPADLGFEAALAKVPVSVHVGLYRNETARQCTWHVNEAHPLESWGDSRSWDGTVTLQQPQILPLHKGLSQIEVLAKINGDEKTAGNDLVQRTLKKLPNAGGNFDAWFARCLHDGFVTGSAFTPANVTLQTFDAPAPNAAADPLANGSIEVVFKDGTIGDGRFANNGWLVETPDPMSKVTWDNAAYVSVETAEKLGLADNTLLELTIGSAKVEVPTFILPGQAKGSIAIAVGWGRTCAGRIGGDVANEVTPIGRNVYPLRTQSTMGSASNASVRGTGKKFEVASTQDHFVMDRIGMEEREARIDVLIRKDTFDSWKDHPDHVKHAVHHPPLESLWHERSYDGHKWGMSIDLSRCTGCNACVVGCTSENNIPVVGKEQVLRGREMHWIRVDRYFGGDPENPELAHQPLTCHHCENAPCEQVCPVAATSHNEEGLNDMVYNRCIGTRYCGNNCPYKVRRFNYFSNVEHFKEPGGDLYKLIMNPEVTVRSRGVMEKCTFCVQRISEVRKEAKREGRAIGAGEIKTACQQACPTEAIVFGDLANGDAEVTKREALGRSYKVLDELNIKPRTHYLAKITNP